MSTRGIIAVGTLQRWRGIYNDSDSYPTFMGPRLVVQLLKELATGKTLREFGDALLLFDDYANYLAGGVCPYCGMIASPHSLDGTLHAPSADVEGCPDPALKHHEHSDPVDVIAGQWTERDIEEGQIEIEWLYILNPEEGVIHVRDLRQKEQIHVGDISPIGATNFEALECGVGFERCTHLAWAHFPEIDRNGPQGKLNTKLYVGLEPMRDTNYATAYLFNGQRYIPLGGGVHGRYGRSAGIQNPDSAAWYASVKIGDTSLLLPVATITDKGVKEPYPGVTWVFPPTLLNPAETLVSRQA